MLFFENSAQVPGRPTTNILSPTRRAIVFNTIPENSEGGYHPAPLRVRPGSIDQDNVAACHLAQVLIRFHGEQAIEGWFPETQPLPQKMTAEKGSADDNLHVQCRANFVLVHEPYLSQDCTRHHA